MNSKNRLLKYLNPNKKILFLALFFGLIFVLCYLSQPFLIGKALDSSIDKKTFYILLLISLILTLIGTISDYFFELIIMNISQRIIKASREEVYQKINSISLSELDKKKRGDIVQLEIRDMENIASGLFAVFKTFIQGIFTIVITIIMMFMVNWILAVGVIVLSPLSVLMSRFVSRFSHKHYKKQSELQADVSSMTLETLNNIDTIQALNYENKAKQKFEEKNKNLFLEGKIAQFSASWVNPSTRLVNNTIYVLIGISGIIMLAYSSQLSLILAAISLGGLTSFLNYTNQYSKPFNEISGVVNEFETAKSSFKRINDFLNMSDDIDEGINSIDSIDEIRFDNMSFSYDKSKKLIEKLNLKIAKGQKVAIVGPTGAGKTTIINLIMRFYDPKSGAILINNLPNIEISKKSLRRNIGMVLQDTYIFNGSVLDNIKYLKKNSSDEEAIKAAKRAHADDFIRLLPNKYETILTDNYLSSGQKQMIAIARVMLLNPDLVILDEATSNIDTRNEKLISDAFFEITKDKTSIIIAHRLSTIVSSDIIVVMKDGNIVEIGNHKELMKKQGFYYSLYSSQYK